MNVDAQIGDQKNTVAKVQGTGDIEADNVTVTTTDKNIEADEVTVNEGPSLLFIGLLLLGWILPTPMTMFKGAIKYVKGGK